MKCPYCGCQRFYLKDPEDEFETYGFDCASGDVCFDPDIEADEIPELDDVTRIYCDKCAWHGTFGSIKA